MSVGYDHVDVQALKSRKLPLGYTPDVLTDAVADLAVMLALMASRNIGEAISVVRSGQWPSLGWSPFALCGPQIGAGASRTKPYTVGFLGFGRIAQATLRRLAPYGISRCIYSNTKSLYAASSSTPTESDLALSKELGIPTIQAVPLTELSKESDLVIILAPGGNKTKHLINEEFLHGMKKMAILVNAARGTLVDTNALVKALKEGWIWGAGLDVIEGEPNITADHPLVKEPRTVLLPHVGSATLDTRVAMATLAVRNLIAGLRGESLEAQAF